MITNFRPPGESGGFPEDVAWVFPVPEHGCLYVIAPPFALPLKLPPSLTLSARAFPALRSPARQTPFLLLRFPLKVCCNESAVTPLPASGGVTRPPLFSVSCCNVNKHTGFPRDFAYN